MNIPWAFPAHRRIAGSQSHAHISSTFSSLHIFQHILQPALWQSPACTLPSWKPRLRSLHRRQSWKSRVPQKCQVGSGWAILAECIPNNCSHAPNLFAQNLSNSRVLECRGNTGSLEVNTLLVTRHRHINTTWPLSHRRDRRQDTLFPRRDKKGQC